MNIIVHMTRPQYDAYKTIDYRDDRWHYSIEKLGFKFNGYEEIDVTSDDLRLYEITWDTLANDHARKGDVLVLVFTDLPLHMAQSLWGLTGCTCCSVTKWNGGDHIHGDESELRVEF